MEVLSDRDFLGTRLMPPAPLEVQDRAVARRKTHQLSIVVAGGTKSKHFGAMTGYEGESGVEPEVGFEPTAC